VQKLWFNIHFGVWTYHKPERINMDFASTTQAPALPGAVTIMGAGPTIGGFDLDTVPTLPPDADALMANAPADRCIRKGCSGKLGVHRGVVSIHAANGVLKLEDSDRCRRQSYVACEDCNMVVPVNHPMQVKLDADWRAVEAKDKSERERVAKAVVSSAPAKATPINPVMSMADAIEAAHDLIARMIGENERLVRRVAALEKKMAALEQGAKIPF
jgi:hypothetical protein